MGYLIIDRTDGVTTHIANAQDVSLYQFKTRQFSVLKYTTFLQREITVPLEEVQAVHWYWDSEQATSDGSDMTTAPDSQDAVEALLKGVADDENRRQP